MNYYNEKSSRALSNVILVRNHIYSFFIIAKLLLHYRHKGGIVLFIGFGRIIFNIYTKENVFIPFFAGTEQEAGNTRRICGHVIAELLYRLLKSHLQAV